MEMQLLRIIDSANSNTASIKTCIIHFLVCKADSEFLIIDIICQKAAVFNVCTGKWSLCYDPCSRLCYCPENWLIWTFQAPVENV